MSQRFSLYEALTVDQNIAFFGGVYGLSRERLAARRDFVLEMAGLRGRERELTRSLAGGWRQRLALGCAILHEPPIVFLDEPTGGVDPLSRRRFWRLIEDLAASGVAVLVTTHYLDEAEHCQRIAIIQAGRLAAHGTIDELKAIFKSRPILEDPGARCGSRHALARRDAGSREDQHLRHGRPCGPSPRCARCPRPWRPASKRKASAVLSCGIVPPSLEDVFLDVAERSAA